MFQFVFGLSAERQAYNGQLYFGEEFCGQGADSLEDAEAKALRLATSHASTARFETGKFRLSVRKPCRICKISGVKPGCKKKACPDCAGRGTTDVVEYVFQVGGGAK